MLLGGGDAADVGAQKQHDFLECCLVGPGVPLEDIPEHHGGVNALQCLVAPGFVELVFP